MQRQSGFTVTEVTLFLGFTAMLFLITLVGTGAFVREARFGDSIHRLESYLQAQYDEVVSGVNPRPDTVSCNTTGVVTGLNSQPGTSQQCLLMGKMIQFDAGSDTVNTYYIVGTEPVTVDSTLPVSSIISLYAPRVVPDVGKDSFVSPWKTTFVQGKRSTMPDDADAVAFIRSPYSSQVITYVFRFVAFGAFGGPGGPVGNPASSTGTTSSFCFRSADDGNKIAAIQIANGQGSNIISTKFDTTVAATCN